jgi:hypothetical protein
MTLGFLAFWSKGIYAINMKGYQKLCEIEVSQMVHAKLQFEPLLGKLPGLGSHDACVVDQDIDLLDGAGFQLFHEFLDRAQVCQIKGER